jgi:hypothetical protein
MAESIIKIKQNQPSPGVKVKKRGDHFEKYWVEEALVFETVELGR